MAVGKNKKISKGKKGGKKKIGDPFQKKEWYSLKAPSIFSVRTFGKTLVTKSQGTKLAVNSLKGRVFEVNLADLNNDEDQGYSKIFLSCEEVQGRQCLTDFYGMDMTRHHMCSLIRKWHSLIEAHADVKTQDGYSLRLFSIAFTERRKNQVKSTCYIRTSKAKLVRKKMVEVMTEEASRCTLKELVRRFPLRMIEKSIEAATRHIFPLQNISIRKVKVLKKPKFDLAKLMELHGDVTEDAGVPMVIEESAAAGNLLTASLKE